MARSPRTSQDTIATLVGQKVPGIHLDIVSVKYTNGGIWTCRLAEMYEGKQYYRIAEGMEEYLTYVTPRMSAGTPAHAGQQDKGPGNRPVTRDLLDQLFEERDA